MKNIQKSFLLLVILLLSIAVMSSATTPISYANGGDDPNSVLSSTMVFEGTLTKSGDAFIGTIPMINEAGTSYGDGESGFDVYAKDGGCAYVQGYYGGPSSTSCDYNGDGTPDADTYVVGALGNPHDAYTSGGPWGTWYDPDCADWDKYELELTNDHWYLRYTPSGESPMSGTMDWATMYASETDLGSQDGGHGGTASKGGGAQAWDCDWHWGVEVIPLEFPGFDVKIESLGGNQYRVTLVPAPGPVYNIQSVDVNGSGIVSNTPTGGDVSINASGTHNITVAKYRHNPRGGHSFVSTGYFDVHLDDISNINNVSVEFCHANLNTTIYYWNGHSWAPCSHQVFDSTKKCVRVTIADNTLPNLVYLTGGPFASGHNPPLPIPEPSTILLLGSGLVGLGGYLLSRKGK